jgi:hypothetical protein
VCREHRCKNFLDYIGAETSTDGVTGTAMQNIDFELGKEAESHHLACSTPPLLSESRRLVVPVHVHVTRIPRFRGCSSLPENFEAISIPSHHHRCWASDDTGRGQQYYQGYQLPGYYRWWSWDGLRCHYLPNPGIDPSHPDCSFRGLLRVHTQLWTGGSPFRRFVFFSQVVIRPMTCQI